MARAKRRALAVALASRRRSTNFFFFFFFVLFFFFFGGGTSFCFIYSGVFLWRKMGCNFIHS
tara:strand:+ start:752 stop:937 length:186 start_codon:yes stop_codon:yes gene_type:complete